MVTYPDVHVADLQAAYEGWPGTLNEKSTLAALVLRIRIERAATRLPRTVIAAASDISHIERRLRLSIGEPGLSPDAQTRRMRTIADATAAYTAICDLLHGRNPNPSPSLNELALWTAAVDALEDDLNSPTVAGPSSSSRSAPGAPTRPPVSGHDQRSSPRPVAPRPQSPARRPASSQKLVNNESHIDQQQRGY
jgi:hypothetical protein